MRRVYQPAPDSLRFRDIALNAFLAVASGFSIVAAGIGIPYLVAAFLGRL